MAGDKNQRISDRAYALWEADGRPHGKDRLHWDQATADIEAEPADVAEAQAEDALEVIEEAKIRKRRKKPATTATPGDPVAETA